MNNYELNDYELINKFLEIFNKYSSNTTGWPMHRQIETKNGVRRWRMTREKYDLWYHKNYIEPDLMREYFISDDIPSDYYEGFFVSGFFKIAVKKEFLLKTLALGFIA